MTDDVTRTLEAIDEGDPQATERLVLLLYDELRALAASRIARERPGQTLDATALVHEAYIKLVDDGGWANRAHFFKAAAETMRRILIDRAREKGAVKRGAGVKRLSLDAVAVALEGEVPEELLELDEALHELETAHPEKAGLVKLRFFAGLRLADAAEILGMGGSTADRHWAFARAWLHRRIEKT